MAKKLEHGKASTYNNHGCRCDLCKAAWNKYMKPRVRVWRKAKKEKDAENSVTT